MLRVEYRAICFCPCGLPQSSLARLVGSISAIEKLYSARDKLALQFFRVEGARGNPVTGAERGTDADGLANVHGNIHHAIRGVGAVSAADRSAREVEIVIFFRDHGAIRQIVGAHLYRAAVALGLTCTVRIMYVDREKGVVDDHVLKAAACDHILGGDGIFTDDAA